MGDITNNAKFRAVAEQITARLADRGLKVMPLVVNEALESGVQRVAEQLGITPLDALSYANPRQIAAELAEASQHGVQGIRPVRDGRTAELPAWTAGKVIAGLSQAVKYAAANDGGDDTGGYAGDLLTEFGLALLSGGGDSDITIEAGALTEAAGLLEQVAGRIEAGEWTHCPCGTDHGQADIDRQIVPPLRDDAAFARMVAERAPGDPDPADRLKPHDGQPGLRLVD